MLIDADSNTKTGYNGADYDLYVEAASGKLNAYLYQLSSTGVYELIKSIGLAITGLHCLYLRFLHFSILVLFIHYGNPFRRLTIIP